MPSLRQQLVLVLCLHRVRETRFLTNQRTYFRRAFFNISGKQIKYSLMITLSGRGCLVLDLLQLCSVRDGMEPCVIPT